MRDVTTSGYLVKKINHVSVLSVSLPTGTDLRNETEDLILLLVFLLVFDFLEAPGPEVVIGLYACYIDDVPFLPRNSPLDADAYRSLGGSLPELHAPIR